MVTRRGFLTRAAGVAAAVAGGRRLWALPAHSPTPITVYKSKSCGCCAKWVDHVKAAGFAPVVHDEEEMDAIKDDLGVPTDVRSCHTAIVEKYLIEGHVPASDIRRLLADRPDVLGLAVPAMPPGSPGMLAPGAAPEPYDVVAFTTSGTTSLFARH
jgi:hypothetical protein